MEYYIYEKISVVKDTLTIEKDPLRKHLSTVLRKKVGENLELCDGKGNLFRCKILYISKNIIKLEVIERKKIEYDTKVKVTLFLSHLRNMSRFEFAIEKCVELGVIKIIPVITDNTVNKSPLSKHKLLRLKNIIKSATGQSQRCYLTELSESIYLKDINKFTGNGEKIVMYEFADYNKNFELNFNNYNINLLIGPEGGFNENEVSFLIENGWKTYSLGNRKLRAETAAIVSVYELINHSIIKK